MNDHRNALASTRTTNRIHAQRTRGLSPVAAGRLREVAQFLTQGNIADADLSLMAATLAAPTHAEVLRWSGELLLRQGRRAEALATFEKSLVERPHDASVLCRVASILSEFGEDERALVALRDAAEHAKEPTEALEVALALDQQGYVEDCLALTDRVLRELPGNSQARLLRARCQHVLGQTEAAADTYRKLIGQGEHVAESWYAILDQKTVRIGATEFAALERHVASGRYRGEEGNMLLFALGKALEDAGRYELAFETLTRANANVCAQHPWDAERFSAFVDEVRDSFAATATRADNEQGGEVVFIVGLPRSGTTLIEHVLAAHPDVEGASELPYLQRIIDAESQMRRLPFPQWVPLANASDWTRMGQQYLKLSARWRARRPRATDKLPANWLLAGAAMAMLPGARVVGVQRDPLETCWSCYKQLFAPGLVGFAYDFKSLAANWRDCDRLMRFWADRNPSSFRLQRYEDFILDTEPQTRALLKFCGLSFDPHCLRPHESERAVRTASAAQVRQPIQKNASRGQDYGALLDPLRQCLQAATASLR